MNFMMNGWSRYLSTFSSCCNESNHYIKVLLHSHLGDVLLVNTLQSKVIRANHLGPHQIDDPELPPSESVVDEQLIEVGELDGAHLLEVLDL
jgi:hypothetical protein